MPYHTINFSDVESFEPMPGSEWYGVEIDHVEVRENKDGDALYLNWELVVVDGDYENRRLWYITSLKDTALFRLKQTFETLGVIDPDETELDIEYDDDIEPTTKSGPRLLYPEVEGLEASAFVKNEMYDGREQNKVSELRGEQPKPRKRKSSDNGRSAARSRRDVEEEEAPRRASRTRSRAVDDDDDTPRRSRRPSRDDDDDYEDEPQPRRRPARQRTGARRRVR
jgi:Protein of unknown function (DUF669)